MKNINLSTTTSITTTYAGESAGKYIAAALLSAPTLEKGGITIMPNVKFKQVIKRVATDNIIKNATCDFDPTSTITLTEKILQPESFQVNLQLCKTDFRSDWDAIQMGYSAFDVLPKSFADFLIAHAAEKVAAGMETSIWQGVDGTAGQFSGIMTQLDVDAALPAGQKIAGTTVTAANVITELGLMIDALPAALYGKEDLVLYVSSNIYRAYVRALGGFAAAGVGANGYDNKGTNQVLNDIYFDGVKIFLANGLANNTALLAQTSNLFFATGLMNDMNEVRVIDMAENDGSQNVRVILRFSADVKYGFASDVVSYGI
jgi:hypothetical protein